MAIPAEGFFLEENVEFPKDFDQFLLHFITLYRRLVFASNVKDIGTYEEVEILNGQQFFGANPQTKVSVFRKCFPFGAIAAGATLNIVHGIIGIRQFTRLYGTCITIVPDDRPIPFSDVALVTNQISILRNGVNIVIVNGATAPAIVSGLVVAEYLKN